MTLQIQSHARCNWSLSVHCRFSHPFRERLEWKPLPKRIANNLDLVNCTTSEMRIDPQINMVAGRSHGPLHCSQWRWPVLLSAGQSGAPLCSKVCPNGSSFWWRDLFDLWVWQTAGGGSIPRWSASKTQDRRAAERQRARTKKNAPPLGEGNHTEKSASDEPIFTDVALYASTGSRRWYFESAWTVKSPSQSFCPSGSAGLDDVFRWCGVWQCRIGWRLSLMRRFCAAAWSILVDLIAVSVKWTFPELVLTLYPSKQRLFSKLMVRWGAAFCDRQLGPRTALSGPSVPFPPWDGMTANGDSWPYFVCGERVVIINSTLSSCERNVRECFRCVQFSVMSQFVLTLFAGPWTKILIGS